MGDKRGIAMEEIVKILIVLVVLLVMVGAVTLLFKGGGGEILDSIRKVLRFGS
jgi:hypothetical protein